MPRSADSSVIAPARRSEHCYGPDSERLHGTLERNAQTLLLRPSLGQGTAKRRVRLKPRLECEIDEGTWKRTAGMGEKSGGTNAGPNPDRHR